MISQNKWDSFDTKKKMKLVKQYFLDIEEMLSDFISQKGTEGVVEIDKSLLQILYDNLDLLKNETDDTLKQIYMIHAKTNHDESIQEILTYLYDNLRPIFNEDIIKQKDFHFLPEILKRDEHKNNKKLPIILILDNLRSAFNVGSIIRTADCLNVEEVWFCGYTPKPDHPKVINTSMGTEKMIKWVYFEKTLEAINNAKETGYEPVALETLKGAKSIYEYKFAGKTALVFGNEALGLSEETIKLCDKCLVLPVSGWKNSLNVATACAVTCFEIYRQLGEKER